MPSKIIDYSSTYCVDEAVPLCVRKCTVDVSISFRGVAVKVSRTENDFERARGRPAVGGVPSTTAGIDSHPDFGLPSSVFSRDAKRMSQARASSLLTPRTQPRIFAMLTTWGLVRRTKVSIRIGRPEGPTAVVIFPVLPVKSK